MVSRLGFIFERKYEGSTLEKIWDTLKAGVTEGATASGIIQTLKDMGVSYRRQDMLSDIRRMGSVAHIGAERAISAEKAMSFYDRIIEPYRKQYNLTGAKAWENYHKWERMQIESEEQLQELEEAAADYQWYRSRR